MNKINFVNLPSTTTPINATNLNQLQTNVDNAKIEKCTNIASTDLNTIVDTSVYYCYSCTNRPVAKNGYLRTTSSETAYCLQEYFSYDGVESYIRMLVNNTWQDWVETTYERRGTWTPTVSSNNSTQPSVTYTTRSANYKKSGNMVFVSFYVKGSITALASGNNYGMITGLPFTPKQTEIGENAISYGTIYNCTQYDAETNLIVYNNAIRLYQNRGAGAANLKETPSGQSFTIAGSGWYETA